MTISIIGASGFIGRYLLMHMSERRDVHGTHFRNPLPGTNICLDVTDRDSVQTFVESYRPDVLIWLSGSKDVSRCELEPNHAFSVNTAPIEVLGSIAKHVNPHMHIILFSTDYVFDGVRGQYRDTDRCYPTTQYGKSKLQAEIILRNCGVPYTIIRTSAVMARGGGFLEWLAQRLEAGQLTAVYKNVFFSPTPLVTLARCLDVILDSRGDAYKDRTVHIAGTRTSRYDFALKVAKAINVDEALIIPDLLNFEETTMQRDLSLLPTQEFAHECIRWYCDLAEDLGT